MRRNIFILSSVIGFTLSILLLGWQYLFWMHSHLIMPILLVFQYLLVGLAVIFIHANHLSSGLIWLSPIAFLGHPLLWFCKPREEKQLRGLMIFLSLVLAPLVGFSVMHVLYLAILGALTFFDALLILALFSSPIVNRLLLPTSFLITAFLIGRILRAKHQYWTLAICLAATVFMQVGYLVALSGMREWADKRNRRESTPFRIELSEGEIQLQRTERTGISSGRTHTSDRFVFIQEPLSREIPHVASDAMHPVPVNATNAVVWSRLHELPSQENTVQPTREVLLFLDPEIFSYQEFRYLAGAFGEKRDALLADTGYHLASIHHMDIDEVAGLFVYQTTNPSRVLEIKPSGDVWLGRDHSGIWLNSLVGVVSESTNLLFSDHSIQKSDPIRPVDDDWTPLWQKLENRAGETLSSKYLITVTNNLPRQNQHLAGAQPSESRPVSWPGFHVKGIIRQQDGNHLVLIDNEILAIGETYKGMRVVELQQMQVLLEREGAQRLVRIDERVPATETDPRRRLRP